MYVDCQAIHKMEHKCEKCVYNTKVVAYIQCLNCWITRQKNIDQKP